MRCGGFGLFCMKFSLAVCRRSAVARRDRCARQGDCGQSGQRVERSEATLRARRDKRRPRHRSAHRCSRPDAPGRRRKGRRVVRKTTTFPKKVWTFRSISACFEEKLSVFETLKAYKRRERALKRVEDAIFRPFDLTEIKNSANFALRQFVVFRFNVTKKLHFITI